MGEILKAIDNSQEILR